MKRPALRQCTTQNQRRSSIMISACCSATELAPHLHLVPEGVKFNGPNWIECMELYVMPSAGTLCEDWTLILDNAPSHTCRLARGFYDASCRNAAGSPRVVMQPPHSPDLSPLDFCVFHLLKKDLPVSRTLADLRVHAVTAWTRLRARENSGVEKLGQGFMRRLEACIADNGSHFEC